VKVSCINNNKYLWLQDDDQIVGSITESGFQFYLCFLERFLLVGNDFGNFANDQITRDEFTRFGEDVVTNDDGRKIGDVGELRSVVCEFVLAFLTRASVNGEGLGFVAV
jgi:hypothetical protein